MKRAVIYNRCSTEEETQMNALAVQAAESREIVINNGWQVIDQYIESESGTTIHKRSEYQRLLEDMETDKFDIVVIKSIDRLMRSARDWYIFIDRLTQNQKQLYIYIDHKFYTPEDSLLTGIKAILAEDFSRELSKKIKNAHKRRQEKKSGFNITVPIFGWNKISKDVYEINEEEAEAYRLAFALAKEGKGFYTIANIMYQNGIRGKNGKRISDVQWRKMLYSPKAHGTVVLHTSEYNFETKKKIQLPEREWIYIENALPPIINLEYHQEVLSAIAARKRGRVWDGTTGDKKTVRLYDFSGKIYCAECGAVYYRTAFVSGDSRLVEWKCATALKHGRKTEKNPYGCSNCNVIEDTVWEILENTCKKQYKELFGYEEDMVEEFLVLLGEVIKDNSMEHELVKYEKELEKLKKNKRVLFSKLMDEVIEDSDFKAANRELSERIHEIQDKISNEKVQIGQNIDYETRMMKIREALQSGLIDKAKTKELMTRIEKIIVHPDNTLEIIFDKFKMYSLLHMYHSELSENKINHQISPILVKYTHRNNSTKKREYINEKILELFQENSELMLKEIPDLLGTSVSYINTSVKQLKAKGMLRYVRNGNTHTGKWIVNKRK